MTNRVVLLAIALSPFQNFAIPLVGSRYDLTAFLLLGVGVAATFKNGRVSPWTLGWLGAFTVAQLAVFALVHVAPLYRLVSGLVWMGGWLLLLRAGHRVAYDRRAVVRVLLAVLLLSALRIFVQALLGAERPSAWFDEPSFAGLSFYSASAAIIGVLLMAKTRRSTRRRLLAALVAFLAAAALTLSLHVVTFSVMVLFILAVRLSAKPLRISPGRALAGLLILALLAGATPFVLRVEHFSERLNVLAPSTNFSVLSWLRGFDQARAAARLSPLFGMGLGSTGFFPFESEHSAVLERAGISNLNLTDAYSLAFRLIIEIGLPVFALGCFYGVRRVLAFRRYLKQIRTIPTTESLPQVFLFVFAVSLVVGSLLKEPAYARSSIYLGIFLLSSARLAAPSHWRSRLLARHGASAILSGPVRADMPPAVTFSPQPRWEA